jgi:hypothetical protein
MTRVTQQQLESYLLGATVIRELVLQNRDLFLEKWNAYFSGNQ